MKINSVNLSIIEYYWDLIWILTQKEIKVRYKSSFLGYIWSIAHPLAFAMTYYFVFQVIMRFTIEHYALFLIAGLFPWQAFSNSVSVSNMVFVSNTSLIKRVYFPRYFLILSTLLNDMFHFLMSIPVVIVFLFVYGVQDWNIYVWLFYIPLNLFSQFLFTFGLSLMIASINLFFRDLERLVSIFLHLWFYFTPIFYSAAMVPKKFGLMLQLNPLSTIITNWRNIFMHYSFDWLLWSISLAFGMGLTVIGSLIYNKLNPKFSEVV